MNILYHLPAPETIYAGRTIYHGYKHAFTEMGHTFRTLTIEDDQQEVFQEFKPDIFITSIGPFPLKYLDLELVKTQKRAGMKVFVNTPFWKSPLSKFRVTEVHDLSQNQTYIDLIKSGDFGDIYYNVCEQGDERMSGFEEATGYKPHTILLAADKTVIFPEFAPHFKADISYIGTYLPEKADFIQKHVFPLQRNYHVKLYGQDWTFIDKMKGLVQKAGQYFNIPYIRALQKPKLNIEDERRIYTSSTIAINIHEDYQKIYGDLNERTFKIPLAGGFQIIDNVPTIPYYFEPEKEIIIAHSTQEWFEKIKYYMNYPEKRIPIISAGREKVLKYHTYHHRVEQMLTIYNSL